MNDYKNLRLKSVDYGFGWHEYDNPSTDGIENILERLDEKYGKLEQENAKLKEQLNEAENAIEFYAKPWERGEFENDLVVRIAGSYDHFIGVHESAREYFKKWRSDE